MSQTGAWSPKSINHYAWGGRLCLHPFNLGLGFVTSRQSRVLNFKAYLCRVATEPESPFRIRDWVRGEATGQIAN